MPAIFRVVLAFAVTAFSLALLIQPNSAHAGMIGTDMSGPNS